MSTVANKFFTKLSVCPPAVKHIYLYPYKDTMISEANPLLNYGMFQNILVNDTIKGDNAGLFGFNGVNLADYKISKDLIASVKFHMAINQQTASSLTLKAQKITDNGWAEYGATWAGQPAYNDATYGRVNVAGNASAINMDLTNQFKADYNTYFNKEFGLRITSESMIRDEMTVLSREAQYGRPCIDIAYYDYSETPTFVSVDFVINPEIGTGKDITFDLNVVGTDVSCPISFDFTVPIYNAHNDVDFSFDVVQREEPSEIGIDFTVPKFALDPAIDVGFDFTAAGKIGNGTDNDGTTIGFDLTVVAEPLVPVDIGFTFSSVNKLGGGSDDKATNIGFDLTVTPEPTSVDVGFTIIPIAAIYSGGAGGSGDYTGMAQIGFDVTVSALTVEPVDIGFTFDTTGGQGVDIGFDVTVPSFKQDPTDIGFDFTISHDEDHIIDFKFDVLARNTQDVDFDFEVVPIASADVGFDFTAVQHEVVDIGFDVECAQRTTCFIGIDFQNIVQTGTEVKFDVWPKIGMKREIGFSFMSLHVSATYGFIM